MTDGPFETCFKLHCDLRRRNSHDSWQGHDGDQNYMDLKKMKELCLIDEQEEEEEEEERPVFLKAASS
ncbi:hypothetical protein HZH66_000113 [Vespula vulgaris]|uniref:Uncharacterized protein n=1 Tax=Vespula vulgaris TaxID=7454 RepID=A0A834KQY8_VESVU|nr:hypothetical protein HZH66_000113 [Vespula vulgaris]